MASSRRPVTHCAACLTVLGCVCVVPPLGSDRESAGGGGYVVVCGACDAKLYTRGLACICPHCGAWLEFTWPVPYNSVPLIGKGKGKP